MDRDGEGNLSDIGRNLAERDIDRLIIALAFAGPVVAGIDDAACGVLGIVIEYKVVSVSTFPCSFVIKMETSRSKS